MKMTKRSVNWKTGQWNSSYQKNKKKNPLIWDTIKWSNLYIIGIPGEEGEKSAESLFYKIMAENFPNLGEGNRHVDPRRPSFQIR